MMSCSSMRDAPIIMQYMADKTTLEVHVAWLIATTICNKDENPQLVLRFLEQYPPTALVYETVTICWGCPSPRQQPVSRQPIEEPCP